MKKSKQMPLSEIFFGSSVGASHIKNGKYCQDALSIKEGTFRGVPFLILSMADGHGSGAHCHSDQGAFLATSAAEEVALRFMLKASLSGERFSETVRQELKAIWIESVKRLNNTFHPDIETIRKYGTTILMALVYDEQVYLAQLGDGEICYLDNEKKPVFLVQPKDGPIDSATESLCSQNADSCWNVGSIPLSDISFLMLSTDGLINSFSSTNEYIRFAKILDGYFDTHKPAQINAVLPEWLAHYSEEGVGDDISLIAVNLKPNKNSKGEEDGTSIEETRIQSGKKTGTGWAGRSLRCQKGKRAFRIKGLQQVVCYPGAKGYYLLPGQSGRTRRKVR